jgi:maltokinase
VSAERDRGLQALTQAWLRLRSGGSAEGQRVTVVRSDVLKEGRPGLLDIVARVGDPGEERLAHLVVGLRGVGEEPHLLRAGEDCVLGLLDDDSGLAVCTDALRDAQLAPLLLATVRGVAPRPGPVTVVRDDEDTTVLDCGDRGDLVVFPWLSEGPRPDVDMLVALEAAGFNHLAAPLVRWTWEGRDLGVVQEPLADRSVGWALALTSLRDLYASRGAPEAAGGDFGAEARALGTMTARMHLALDRAFWREKEPVSDWVDAAEAAIAEADRSLLDAPGVGDLMKWIREPEARLPAIRAHGDFHLGRTARTDQGWVVSDCRPGGVRVQGGAPVLRPPLADVADLLWSMHRASVAAASERDPTGRLGLEPLGQAWQTRNRRALMAGYLGTPGIAGLVGPDRSLVLRLVSFLELARSVRE